MTSQLTNRNLLQIERLNQRGGETLSIAHLIAVGTVDVKLSAYLLAAVAEGASILTAARPGGAGKSTLLANLLAFLPPDEEIETVSGGREVARAFSTPLLAPQRPPRLCWLAHELGSGHYYGYIWGRDAAQFLAIPRKTGARIASCLHADTLEEVQEILLAPPLNAEAEDLRNVGLIAFMYVDRSGYNWQHRVASVWETQGNEQRLIWQWDRREDCFVQVSESHISPARLSWAGETIAGFIASEETRFEAMQQYVAERYALQGAG